MTMPLPPLPTPWSLTRDALAAPIWPAPRLVLIALVARFDPGTGCCVATLTELAESTGHTERIVRECLRTLECWGAIERPAPDMFVPRLPLRPRRIGVEPDAVRAAQRRGSA